MSLLIIHTIFGDHTPFYFAAEFLESNESEIFPIWMEVGCAFVLFFVLFLLLLVLLLVSFFLYWGWGLYFFQNIVHN